MQGIDASLHERLKGWRISHINLHLMPSTHLHPNDHCIALSNALRQVSALPQPIGNLGAPAGDLDISQWQWTAAMGQSIRAALPAPDHFAPWVMFGVLTDEVLQALVHMIPIMRVASADRVVVRSDQHGGLKWCGGQFWFGDLDIADVVKLPRPGHILCDRLLLSSTLLQVTL